MGAAKGSAVGVMVGLVGLAALIWLFYCLFKLSTAIEPRRGVAWSMLALQLVPVVGLVAVVSLVLKAGKIISGAAQVAEQSRS